MKKTIRKNNKRVKFSVKKNLRKKIKKGGSKTGPYASKMNMVPSYARFGAPGSTQIWNFGTTLKGGKKNKKGGTKYGPYFSIDNQVSSYSRYGSPGLKVWKGGIKLN